MKKLKSFWKANSIITIFCFLLPFIPPMCSNDEPKGEAPDADTAMTDTSSVFKEDSVIYSGIEIKDTVKTVNSSIEKDTLKETDDTSLKFILMPDGKNLSGIGFIYNYGLWGLSVTSLPASLFLLIISLFIGSWKIKRNLFSIGFCCLGIFGFFNYEELLYGYWITAILYLSSVILIWIIQQKLGEKEF